MSREELLQARADVSNEITKMYQMLGRIGNEYARESYSSMIKNAEKALEDIDEKLKQQ